MAEKMVEMKVASMVDKLADQLDFQMADCWGGRMAEEMVAS